jgi:DNA-binding MarR family transcriptional regulator
MVVKSREVELDELDLGHLALFVGQRVNELVMARMKKSGAGSVRQSHGYVIQHLIGKERSITELAARMEVTQQAASKSVAELVELGILEAAEAQDRRAKLIRLTRRGLEMVKLSRKVRAEIDQRLVKVLGKKAHVRVRERLAACLNELGGVQRVRARRVREPN